MSAATSAGRTLAMGEDETGDGTRRLVEAPFGRALARVAKDNPGIVGVTADLGKYTDILPFRDAFPDRFFNVGMAEQNLVAVAAGLARTGKTVFATTYGVFASRRPYAPTRSARSVSSEIRMTEGRAGAEPESKVGSPHPACANAALDAGSAVLRSRSSPGALGTSRTSSTQPGSLNSRW